MILLTLPMHTCEANSLEEYQQQQQLSQKMILEYFVFFLSQAKAAKASEHW